VCSGAVRRGRGFRFFDFGAARSVSLTHRLGLRAADRFVADRNAAAKQARTSGDKELAAQLQALRRPTAAAAVLNRFGRGPGKVRLQQLLDLGAQLREAQRTLDAKALKSLGNQRNSLISELLAAVEEEAGPLTASIREQLTDTFTAAIADGDAGRAVASGRLISGLSYSGFGEVELGDAVAIPLRPEATEVPTAAAHDADTDAQPDPTAAERAQHEAATKRLERARADFEHARELESAATAAADLADRALAAAERTAANARKRADEAVTARETAEKAVAAAEEATTTAESPGATS